MKFVSMLAFVISISYTCLGQSARDIARVAFKSVVLLEMNDSNGQPLSLGSGFFVSNGIIATNAHVIEGASSGTAKLIGDNRTMQILGTVAIDRHADLALLKVESPAPPLVLGPNADPTVGDDVYVVGNPLGLEGTFSEGIISGVRHLDADSILQMTAPISPGSSGGPVMNGSGAVIGVSVATFQDGQNLNLAVPVSYLSGLLASPSKVLLPLGNQTTGNQTEKSLLAGLGTRIESGVKVCGGPGCSDRFFGFLSGIIARRNRGGGNVKISFIDFQGLWEGRETALSFSALSIDRHFHGRLRCALCRPC